MENTVWTQAMELEFQELKGKIFHSGNMLNVFSDEVESSPEMKRYNELMIHRQQYVKQIEEKGGEIKKTNILDNIDLN